MPIILPLDLTSEEIRVLQEFRRLTTEVLPLEKIQAIKHPAGKGGEGHAASLATKGFLTADGDQYTLTPKSKEFLAHEPKPMFEETVNRGAGAVESAPANSA